MARQGTARRGEAGPGGAGLGKDEARHGRAGHGRARLGKDKARIRPATTENLSKCIYPKSNAASNAAPI